MVITVLFDAVGTQLAIAYGYNRIGIVEQDSDWKFGKSRYGGHELS